MKKILFVFGLIFLTAGIVYADLAIDISGSKYESKSKDTFRTSNIVVPGYSGKYWVDFKWDSKLLVLEPLNAGYDTTPSTVYNRWIHIEFQCDNLSRYVVNIPQLIEYSDGTWSANGITEYNFLSLPPINSTPGSVYAITYWLQCSGTYTAKGSSSSYIGTYSGSCDSSALGSDGLPSLNYHISDFLYQVYGTPNINRIILNAMFKRDSTSCGMKAFVKTTK